MMLASRIRQPVKSQHSEPIAHGTGQNMLREALQIADHTAYHTAEIVVIRRLLGIWT